MAGMARSCEQTWVDALKQCRQKLDENDYKLVTEFDSPEKLMDEVAQLEARFATSVISSMLKASKPHLENLRTFSALLLFSIGCNVRAACLWGVTYLLIQLAVESESAFGEIAGFFANLGAKLRLFTIYKTSLEIDPNLLEEFFNLLVDILLDSVEAIKHFRRNDIRTAVSISRWTGVEGNFRKTIQTLESKIDHLRQLCEAQTYTRMNRTQAELVQQLAELTAKEKYVNLPCLSLPFQGNQTFFGREDILKTVDNDLQPFQSGPPVRSVALWGTAGIGKTQVALEYANRKLKDGLQVIIWIASEEDSQLTNSFVKAANILRPDAKGQTPDEKRHFVLQWLQTTPTPWLLIFDNVEDEYALSQNWPVTGKDGSILVTCRSELKARTSASKYIEIPTFNEQESVQLLLNLTGNLDRPGPEQDAAREFAILLGGLAIALDVLAKQVFVRKRTLSRFLSTYNKQRRLPLKRPERGARDVYYSQDVTTIWVTAFEGLTTNGARLLSWLSLVAPEDIPQAMFSPDTTLPELWSLLTDEDEFEEAKTELLDLSLIHVNTQTDMISLHRLTQGEYRNKMSADQWLEAIKMVYRLLDHSFPSRTTAANHHLFHRWKSCEQLIQHVIALMDNIDILQRGPTTSTGSYELVQQPTMLIQEEALTDLLSNAAWYLAETGSFQTCDRVLTLAAESCADKESLAYAAVCYTAGSLNHRRGRYPAALSNYEKALSIREKLCPPDSNMLATSYSAVGFALTGLHRGEEAAKVIEKAFAVFDDKTDAEKLRGYNVDRYYRNLGRAKFYMARFEESKRDVEQSQRWQNRVYGEGSHYHGEAQYDFGKIAMKQGNLQLADSHFQKAYEFMQPGKPTHQSVMAVLYHQGMLRLAEGKAGHMDEQEADKKALAYFERCLTICQINEPKRGDQGESARVKWRMSQVLERQGKVKEAAAFREAAEKTKATLETTGLFPHVDDYESSWDCFLGQLYR